MPTEPDANMINAAFMLIENMPKGSEERHKRIAAAVWKAMAEFAPQPRPSGLTRLQMQTHEIIAEYIRDNGMAPTYAEIGAQLGKGRSDVHQIIHALKRRGVLQIRGARRAIQLLVQPGEPLTKGKKP